MAIPIRGDVAIFDEQFGRLAVRLPHELREITILKLAGYTNQQIAIKLGCSKRTVERKVETMRQRMKAWLDQ